MNKKNIIITFLGAVLVVGVVGYILYSNKISRHTQSPSTTTTSVRFINSVITAEGNVTAQNQANLHFQIAGKLTSLPFKEGAVVKSGQTIASLDSYTIQKQLEGALNTYRSVRDTFDQTKDNVQDNVQKAQLTNPYDYYSKAGMSDTRESAINDAIKRIVDQNQANLDNSVINVQLAHNAFQLSTLTSPLNGILLHEDVTVPGLNISPSTSFVVADPSTAVFRANVNMNNINYVALGAHAEIAIDGIKDKLIGTVVNIYPSKVVLQNGQSVYQVDIQSDQLLKLAKLDQTGTALIKTNSEHVALVPMWTVLGGKYVWVNENNKPELKTVSTGKVHGQDIEITSGLTSQDKIIINPEYIQSLQY
ncbi:MAG: efflux RND transporter periplasmic adaptor subunit [Candidatus Roizmanbacteria bacterium]|nr:efflux RND transporter periplasmic adaptor subunit [Candidatus Roizmanbacteria bacterium]